jgi:hypothetical protein
VSGVLRFDPASGAVGGCSLGTSVSAAWMRDGRWEMAVGWVKAVVMRMAIGRRWIR